MNITLINTIDERHRDVFQYEWNNHKDIIEKLFKIEKAKPKPRKRREMSYEQYEKDCFNDEDNKWKGKSLDGKVLIEIVSEETGDCDISCMTLALHGEPKYILPLLEQIIPTKEFYKKWKIKSPWGDNVAFLKEVVDFT